MNMALLLKVKEEILAHPEQFDMDEWECGTSACIAGWAGRLSGKLMNPDVTYENGFDCYGDMAASLLGIRSGDANALFFTDRWPEEFLLRDGSTTPKLAAKRIDHFIATNGEE